MHRSPRMTVAGKVVNIMEIKPKDIERFWSKVNKSEGCWLWTAGFIPSRHKHSRGYGQFGIAGKIIRANRVAYMITYGDIPQGMQVLHRCDTPECVRPDHLFLGTHAENMADKAAKGRVRHGKIDHRGERNPSAKLTDAQAAEIKQLVASGRLTQAQIAATYGVSGATVSRISRRS